MSAEGDMITSAIGLEHGSVAIVRASSHAILGTVTVRAPPAALAHTGGSTWSHPQSELGQSCGWIAWLGLALGLGLGLGLRSTLGSGLGPVVNRKGQGQGQGQG